MSSAKKILLFKCIGVLVDGRAMRQNYQNNMAQIMTKRYGKSPDIWLSADKQIVADWADYHADLNFSGEDGIADIHEGLFRVTCALFKITQVDEPSKSEITVLAQDLMTVPYTQDIFFAGVLDVLERCQQAGYEIGIFSYFLQKQVSGMFQNIPHIKYIIGADTLNHYEHDANYFLKLSSHLKTSPNNVIVISNSAQINSAAIQTGMNTLLVGQSSALLKQELKHLWE